MLKGPLLSQRQALSLSLPKDKKIQALQNINYALSMKVLNCLVNLFSNVRAVSSDLLDQFGEKSSFSAYWHFQQSNKKQGEILNQIGNVLEALKKYSHHSTLSPKQQTLITSFIERLTMYQTVIGSCKRVAQPLIFSSLASTKENGRTSHMDVGIPLELSYKGSLKKI